MLNKINHYLQLMFRFFPIFLFKYPLHYKFPLHAIMPASGFFHILHHRKLRPVFFPLIAMFGLGIISCLYYTHYIGVLRCLQALGLVFMCQFLMVHFKREDFIKAAEIILFVSLGYVLLEAIFIGPITKKKLLSSLPFFPRFLGMIGESNFTAICTSLMTLIVLYFGQRKWVALFGVASLIFMVSRISILILLIGVLGLVISRFSQLVKKYILIVFFSAPILFPLIIFLIEKLGNDNIKLMIEKFSNGRYVISASYLGMFFKNPLGVGFFRGKEIYKAYAYDGTTLTKNGIFKYSSSFPEMIYEHHNMFMQTLSEFGFWGYGLFVFFLIGIFRKLYKTDFLKTYYFCVLLFGFCSLNAFAEYVLYFSFAFLLQTTMGNKGAQHV